MDKHDTDRTNGTNDTRSNTDGIHGSDSTIGITDQPAEPPSPALPQAATALATTLVLTAAEKPDGSAVALCGALQDLLSVPEASWFSRKHGAA
jgi:hypothetical protein